MATLAMDMREGFAAPASGEQMQDGCLREPRAIARATITAVPVAPAGAGGYERSVYSASRKSGPVALLASAGMVLGMGACLMALNMVSRQEARPHLAVVELRNLDTTPPPPAPQPTTLAESPAPLAQPVAPRPMIEIPAPGPVQIVAEAPAQPVAAPPAPVAGTAPAAPAAAPAAPASTVEGGDLSSKVLFAKPPLYPVEARRAREQGTVKLLVLVGTDGCVKDIEIAASSGSQRLDRAALGAVRRWRWTPASSGGAPASVRGYVTIPFVLKA